AASEFYKESEITSDVAAVHYHLKTEDRMLTPEEWLDEIKGWTEKYPLISIEDPFDQDHWEFLTKLNQEAKESGVEQIVGDDLLVTNVDRIQTAIEKDSCSALLVKLNQIGSLSETLAAMQTAQAAGWKNVVSHRSGETEDVFISHL